jgi:ABC-2 type transport system ATP-binding protein
MSESPTLAVRGVRKSYTGHVAVDEVTFEVPAGSVYGLLGQNGAGKTTTLRMILDILAPDRGEVHLFGRPRRPEDAARIGYLPEERGLYRRMTVADHLLFQAELHGVARAEARARIESWLARVELAAWAKAKVEALSKGMQQKVQLVAILLHQPELLILDEPFSGLDPINQALFKETIAELRRAGRTVLFSTHVLEQAEKLCDRICLISRGRVVLEGELARIKRERGGNAFEAVWAGEPPDLSGLPDVLAVEPHGASCRLHLAPGASPAALLAALVARGGGLTGFRSLEPDLETLFVQAVRDAA